MFVPREIKGFDGLSCLHDVQSRILTIRMTVLDLVGVLGAVILYFWEASQEVARLLVELAEGLYNDLIGDRYIADLSDQGQCLEVCYLVVDT